MMAQMMAGLGDAFGEAGGEKPANANPLMDRKSYESRAKEMGEGVKLSKLEEIKDAKGGMGVKAVFTVADINKLKLGMSGDMPGAMQGLSPEIEQQLEDAEEKEPITFALKDGKLTINMPQPENAAELDKNKEELQGLEPELNLGPEEKQQMEMAKMMLADMAMSLSIKVNGEVASSNATHREGNTVTLFSMEFKELLKDPNAFGKLAMMGRRHAGSGQGTGSPQGYARRQSRNQRQGYGRFQVARRFAWTAHRSGRSKP